MKDARKSESKGRGAGAALMFLVWFASSLVFLAMLVACSRRYSPAFEALENAPPVLTVFLLNLADFVQSGQGMIIALVVQGATLVPFISHQSGKGHLKLYAVLAIIGLLALAAVWLGLLHPMEQLHSLLGGG